MFIHIYIYIYICIHNGRPLVDRPCPFNRVAALCHRMGDNQPFQNQFQNCKNIRNSLPYVLLIEDSRPAAHCGHLDLQRSLGLRILRMQSRGRWGLGFRSRVGGQLSVDACLFRVKDAEKGSISRHWLGFRASCFLCCPKPGLSFESVGPGRYVQWKLSRMKAFRAGFRSLWLR